MLDTSDWGPLRTDAGSEWLGIPCLSTWVHMQMFVPRLQDCANDPQPAESRQYLWKVLLTATSRVLQNDVLQRQQL